MKHYGTPRQFGKKPKTPEQLEAARRAERRKAEQRAKTAAILHAAFARNRQDG